MPSKGLAWDLGEIIASPIWEEEPMRRHTSWRIGGPAQIMVDLHGIEDLRQIVKFTRDRSVPLTVIGAGTNLLVRDGGIRGLVVKLGAGMDSLNVRDGMITAGAGLKLGRLSAAACDAGIGGFEFLAGIPGTVGGAVVMNAGANGSSVSKVVKEVVLLDREGNIFKREASELGFGYRRSNLLNSEYIVVEAVFRGEYCLPEIIREKINDFLTRRRTTQPYDLPNGGSVFKNPPGDSAGRLIESAGCKGLAAGDAQVSLKHANFIVNLGEATAMDVVSLINTVRNRVNQMSGIQLVTEVQILGDN
ncbi:UDP-N-acetylenolpyruvoylglucosamine reductase [Desulfocucumis palustris]|uniref:UDP-N-acetylenolpyruvoylglucosamine reductase n=1 Tax=Desulfocucumis palustris TaxID=1898651 RepID=A0A2L2XFI6_9FIRM|nr:UDP-N-acetylmuramate dehydrogenase [Desulfocucumis palustris]GBF34453.1 UDP-N-acetylenolpyruvoylglucosamine reductase [Desulfocucumis palustris]